MVERGQNHKPHLLSTNPHIARNSLELEEEGGTGTAHPADVCGFQEGSKSDTTHDNLFVTNPIFRCKTAGTLKGFKESRNSRSESMTLP